MPEPDQATRVIRFGVFEVDLHTTELRKQGVRIRLPLQSFQVLEALLRQPGELVTRKELKEKLWPADSFGDFEHGLNAAVNRVREALGDSSDNPRFVETLPRRGYRFLAPVNGAPQSTAAGLLEDGEAGKRVASPTSEFLDSIAVLPFENAGSDPEMVTNGAPLPAKEPDAEASATVVSAFPGISALVIGTMVVLIGIATFLWSRQKRTTSSAESRLITSFGFAPALSRDGKLLAYCSDLGDGGSHILVQQTAGGEAIPLTTGPFIDVVSDFSPDGTHIAFSSTRDGGGIYIIPTLRGEPRVLVRNPHAKFIAGAARFSPAGDTLLFVLDEKAFTVLIDGGRPIALPLNQKFLVYGPAIWAPDGKEVLFYGVRRDEQSKPASWWIVPLSSGRARQPNLPGIERNLVPPISVRSWFRAADGREWIVYSTSDAASWKIWRARVSLQGTTDESPELVTSGSGVLEYVSSVSEDGKLSYNIVSVTMSIHQISTGDRGQKTGPTVQLPLPEGGNYTSPSVSWDGKKIVYVIANQNQPNLVMLRDLTTGKDHLVDDKGRRRGAMDYTAEIAPDGSTVIFERDCKQGMFPEDHMSPLPCSFTVSAAGGEPEQICERCSPHGFSSDGSVLLFNKFDLTDGNKDRIASMNLRTRSEQDFLSDPKQSLYNANLSWDKRWVVFRRASTGGFPPSQILIAPLLNGLAAGAADWIAVTNTRYSDDQPRFSPDGNTLYFTSDRDGYLCIWTQRLDPLTKNPVGAPVAYEHFHNSAGHNGISDQRFLYLSFARDKILLELEQGRSDLWMTKME